MTERISFDRLVDRGLVDPEARDDLEVALGTVERNPLYMQVISGTSGLVASLFFVSFVLCSSEATSWVLAGICGALLLTASLAARVIAIPAHHILANALVSARLTGAGLLVGTIGYYSDSLNAVALSGLALCVILYPLEPDRLMKFIAGGFAYVCLGMLVAENLPHEALDPAFYTLFGLGAFAAAILFGRLGLPSSLRHELEPLGYASVCFALLAVYASMFSDNHSNPLILRGIMVAAALLVLGRAWSDIASDAREPLLWCAGAVIFLATLTNTGLLVALLAMLLGARGHQRPLTLIGAASLLPFLSHYYYWLDVSLLAKSIALVVTSAFFLGLRWLIRQRPWMRTPLDAQEAP